MNFRNSTIRTLALAGIAVMMLACSGGSISSSGESSIAGAMTVQKVFPTSSGASWTPITSGGRYYIKGLNLSIRGTCSRGIVKIRVNRDADPDYTQEATCDANGNFAWNRLYTGPEEGDFQLTITAYDQDDLVITGSAVTVNVRVDNTAPAAPVVTTPATDPFQYNGSTAAYTIIGTTAADTFRITGPNASTITPTGVNWSHGVTLINGASTDYTYYAWDLAGNQSAAVTPTIEWAPSVDVKIAGTYFLSGTVNDGGTSYKMDVTGQAYPDNAADGVSNFNLMTGFNNVTNQVRAD